MMNTQQFLGLKATHNPHRWVLPITEGISTRGNFMFGGCGLAAAVTALELTCERPLIWATAQYLSYARPPSIMDIDVIVPVAGNNVTQARAVGHVGDQEILTVNAALGQRDIEVEGEWATRPEVPAPADCPAIDWGWKPDAPMSIDQRAELRVALGRFGKDLAGAPSEPGRSALWVRMKEGLEVSAATLAIIADWVPSGLAQAFAQRVGGNSLDNTIRILNVRPTEWVLCDIRIHGVRNGFGHGLAHLWAEDGRLLATASQSLIVRIWDKGRREKVEAEREKTGTGR